jgi:hypothetical protein
MHSQIISHDTLRAYENICMYMCTYVCAYEHMYVHMNICMCICTYVCVYVHMYVHMNICMHICTNLKTNSQHTLYIISNLYDIVYAHAHKDICYIRQIQTDTTRTSIINPTILLNWCATRSFRETSIYTKNKDFFYTLYTHYTYIHMCIYTYMYT